MDSKVAGATAPRRGRGIRQQADIRDRIPPSPPVGKRSIWLAPTCRGSPADLGAKLNFLQYNEIIGDKIKQLRNKQGLTQDGLARKSDLPYTTLTKIESNVITKPTIQTVMKIAKGLGITLDDLMK